MLNQNSQGNKAGEGFSRQKSRSTQLWGWGKHPWFRGLQRLRITGDSGEHEERQHELEPDPSDPECHCVWFHTIWWAVSYTGGYDKRMRDGGEISVGGRKREMSPSRAFSLLSSAMETHPSWAGSAEVGANDPSVRKTMSSFTRDLVLGLLCSCSVWLSLYHDPSYDK